MQLLAEYDRLTLNARSTPVTHEYLSVVKHWLPPTRPSFSCEHAGGNVVTHEHGHRVTFGDLNGIGKLSHSIDAASNYPRTLLDTETDRLRPRVQVAVLLRFS